jgi:hypothetical protein
MDNKNTEVSRAAKVMRVIAITLLILMPLSALGTRFGIWPYTLGMLLFAAATLGSLLIQIIIAIWFLRKPATDTKRLLRHASFAALLPLLVVGSIMSSMVGGGGKGGAIHNISTDQETPPQFSAAQQQRPADSNPLAYTAEIAEIQQSKYPELDSIRSQQTTAESFTKALATAKAMDWEVYAQSPTSGIIEAVDTTFWFGFKDDIVIRVQASDSGSQIDLHSVSRVGQSDMGANAKRIQAFIERFNN